MKTFIISLLFILMASSSHAQQASDDAAQLEAVQFFQDYVADYNDYLSGASNAGAISAVTQHFHMPLLQFPKSGAVALDSREQLGKNLQGFLDGLKSKGIARITWQKLQVHSLDDNTIVANNIANAIATNGKVAKQMAAFYILNKSAGEWRIASLKQHSLDTVLSF